MRPSEIAAGVGVVCLLLTLLTWLLVRGIATDAAVYSTMLRIFDDFALAEASLDRDVLQARAGLLTNYDPLVRSSEQIDAAVSQLRAQVASDELDTGPVDRLAAATQIEEKLTERFKSDNALLHNSLSYVVHLSTSPGIQRSEFSARSAGNGHSPTHSRLLSARATGRRRASSRACAAGPERGGPGNCSGSHFSRSRA